MINIINIKFMIMI